LYFSEEPRFDSLLGQGIFLPPQRPDGLYGPSSFLWAPGALFARFKRPGREADLSHLVPTWTALPFSKYRVFIVQAY
jgi:hypothetical protein